MAEPEAAHIPDIIMDSPQSTALQAEDMGTELSEETYESDSTTDISSVEDDHHVPQGLPTQSLPTGLCYDERMRYHSEVYASSAEAVHPEDPRRIYYIFKELCEAGLVQANGYTVMVSQPLLRIDAREATKEEICLVHTDRHYEFVKSTAAMSNEELIDLSESAQMDSIYFNKLSYYAGKLSAGGAIETCKAVMERRVKNAIAVIRPPGHHAEVSSTMGFCLFNNTCVASRVCQGLFGEACRKILILDWDVHHGNGCQKAFYNDPNILYVSIHVHWNGNFYPSGPEGGMDRVGVGAGLGYNVNIPWTHKGMGDGDYMYAFQQVVMPIANEFDPDFVVVSAGFDAAAGDELGGCNVTPPCYAHMTHMLMSLAGGKVAVCLEGGYNFKAISRSALAVTRTLMGEPPDRLEPTSPTESAVKVVEQVKAIHSQYWRSLYPKAPVAGIFGGERLHDIIRQWQAQHLFDEFKLTELLILRNTVSKSFEKQVLASISYENRKHLIVFFHDPPDLFTHTDPMQPQQAPHNTYMHDPLQTYIYRSLITHRTGLIDINIPQFVTPHNSSDSISYTSTTNDLARTSAAHLSHYLWDNYIAPYPFPGGIFLLGSGASFDAIIRLLNSDARVAENISGIIGFLGAKDKIRPSVLEGHSNDGLTNWFRRFSRIFVSDTNEVWDKERQGRKISRKYGDLRKVHDAPLLSQVMEKVVDEVFQFIEEQCSDDVPLYRQPAPLPAVMVDHRALHGDDTIMSEGSNSSPEQKRAVRSRPVTPGKGRADAIRDPMGNVSGSPAGLSPRSAVAGPPQEPTADLVS